MKKSSHGARRFVRVGVLVLGLVALAGCGIPNLLIYPFAPREAKRQVSKEYDLGARRLLILPYVGPDVLFEFEGVDMIMSGHVIDQIDRNMRGRIQAVISPAEVLRYQQANLDWPNTSVKRIGEEFGADKVLYIELRRFSVMEERSANLYRGRASAHVQVVDTTKPNDGVVYQTDISIEFPEDRPLGTVEVSQMQIQQITLHLFADTLVKKFYDHEEMVLGGGGR